MNEKEIVKLGSKLRRIKENITLENWAATARIVQRWWSSKIANDSILCVEISSTKWHDMNKKDPDPCYIRIGLIIHTRWTMSI